jgi:Zn-dependent alcohol dehydrogenase
MSTIICKAAVAFAPN